jgi:hypothetical protein
MDSLHDLDGAIRLKRHHYRVFNLHKKPFIESLYAK